MPWLERGPRRAGGASSVAAGRVATAAELAAALRARHGAGRRQHQSTRGRRAGGRARGGRGTRSGRADANDEECATPAAGRAAPRRRRADRAGVAARHQRPERGGARRLRPGPGHAAPTSWRDAEPLPGRGVVVRELRAVAGARRAARRWPTPGWSRLAARCRSGAAASPRLELYPRGLDLVAALRIAQAGAGVRRGTGITVDDLLAKVRARFPELALPTGLTHVQLRGGAARRRVRPGVRPRAKTFRPPAPELSRVGLGDSTSLSGRPSARGWHRPERGPGGHDWPRRWSAVDSSH